MQNGVDACGWRCIATCNECVARPHPMSRQGTVGPGTRMRTPERRCEVWGSADS
ncbi:hypothetical protein SCHPADRAFT_911333 [Schizopora paradoxa]|uniref:Uncharacterized protein n=1 Tax=Schizopora paradoxa TaxID=27342 RepID=A0A0H2QZN2_9AGAM|nr:hypothetical protein SCHPADRAFT_911333 [Schizopora paradoxa]